MRIYEKHWKPLHPLCSCSGYGPGLKDPSGLKHSATIHQSTRHNSPEAILFQRRCEKIQISQNQTVDF